MKILIGAAVGQTLFLAPANPEIRKPAQIVGAFFWKSDWISVVRFPFKILVLLAVIFWISAFIMFAIGVMMPGLSILRLAAIPDVVLALIFTVFAAQRWAGGPK